MKKIIYIFAIIIATLTLSSCEEKRWQENDLVETEVLTVAISSTDTEAYYIYPEQQFFIYEYNVNLTKYEMSDWSYTEESGVYTITYRQDVSESVYMVYEVLYSSSTLSGRLTISYFEDNVELPEKGSVLSLSSFSTTTELIDLN
ncbi:MAG: hypothetical protein R3Y66_04080 [Rikenellaceae bacterium]